MISITGLAEVEKLLLQRTTHDFQHSSVMWERMQQCMDFLGNPQNRLQVIHVAGTSGKTSTCYYIASLLMQTGKKVGLSVSPYVDGVNERVQINLQPLPERQFCDDLAAFLELVSHSDIQLSRQQCLNAFAYWQFARLGVDYAVVEVGMGGLFDSTNVIDNQNKVCVITDIGLDHQDKLGNSLAEIAGHKAGIIGLHNKVFCYGQSGEVMDAIRERARQKMADLTVLDPMELPATYHFLPLFQKRNFGLARATVREVLRRDGIHQLDEGALLRAASVRIPARQEVFRVGNKTVILDGAHNAQKMQALKQSLDDMYGDQPIAVLAAFKAGKPERAGQTAQELTSLASHIIVTAYTSSEDQWPQGEDPELIAAMCKVHGFISIETVANPLHAWRQLLARPESILLVTGSFYLFNDIRPLLKAPE